MINQESAKSNFGVNLKNQVYNQEIEGTPNVDLNLELRKAIPNVAKILRDLHIHREIKR